MRAALLLVITACASPPVSHPTPPIVAVAPVVTPPPPPPIEARFGACGAVATTGNGDHATGIGPGTGSGYGGAGVIGTGTIGSGIGNAGKPAERPGPIVQVGVPVTDGDLDRAIVRRYIMRNRSKLQYCYEKELLKTRPLFGSVTAKFTITANGKVEKLTTTHDKPAMVEVGKCVGVVLSQIEFPKPKSGVVAVTYPFVFHSEDDDEAAPPKVPPVFDDAAHNPLRAETAAVTSCLRAGTAPYGTGVVSFGTFPEVKGDVDAATSACLLAIAKTISAPGVVKTERCTFAFGTMPIDKLAVWQLGADGKLVPPAGDASMRAAPPIVQIDNAASIESVVLGLGELYATTDVAIATKRGPTWTPLGTPALPSPPAIGARAWDPVMSIRVTKSAVIALHTIARDAAFATNFAAELAAARALPEFATRADCAISGDFGTTFGDVVPVIDAAIAAGFTPWRLTKLAPIEAK